MRNRRARQGLSTVLGIGAMAGLLIWTKLRLVSDLPRSAYAVPHELDRDDGAGERGAPDKAEDLGETQEPADATISD